MQTNLQHVHPPPPRVFQYSLDWRFLLPISDPAKIRVAFEEEADFSEALDRVGIPVSNLLSFSNFKQHESKSIHSLAFPFGLPARWVGSRQQEQIEFYRSVRHLICPGGYLLLGFGNAWTPHPGAQYRLSTPPRMVNQLDQAGFKAITVLGAIPDLRIPEYIFDLNVQVMHFTLTHRFRRKTVLLNMLRMLAETVGLARIANFLPCYFVVASV